MALSTAAHGGFALTAADRARLERRVGEALRRARRHGEALAAITVPVAASVDPTAAIVASRRADEPWFVLEQPERGGAALAALGAVAEIEVSGPERFHLIAARWRALASGAACDPPGGLRGGGPVAVGGFAFADDGGASPDWTGYAPASLHVPELTLVRRDGEACLTLMTLARPDDTAEELVARLVARAEELRDPGTLPLLDPDPAGRHRVVSAMPVAHYEEAVARAVQRIRAGELEKVVLARAVDVHAPSPHDSGAILGVLREAFPGCHLLCVGRGDAAFLAASPELLIRREGLRASTLALAGSTRRSADPAVDDHLGERLMRSAKDREEQAIVARRIARTLRPHAVWVTAAEEPGIARVANIQHLATPIRAQLAAPVGVVELAGLLHPTPAVGGEPLAVAAPLIPALEGLDRGWYAGPVGWVDRDEDGEFIVALRCALVRDRLARCYAGVGVVADSDPAAELAETEIKLQALLPVLAL